ncbi:MAG: Na+-driven multidrug efflux pump, partial [Paracoccaceae bacterium]
AQRQAHRLRLGVGSQEFGVRYISSSSSKSPHAFLPRKFGFRIPLVFGRGITIPVVVILYFLRVPITDMFNAQGVARDLIFLFCGPLSLAWIFNGVIFVGNAAYNNLGHPFYSTWVNWGRNTLGIIPFVYLGSHYWGASGVLIGQMVGGVFVAIASFILAERLMKKAGRDQIDATLEPEFAEHQRSFKMLHHRR